MPHLAEQPLAPPRVVAGLAVEVVIVIVVVVVAAVVVVVAEVFAVDAPLLLGGAARVAVRRAVAAAVAVFELLLVALRGGLGDVRELGERLGLGAPLLRLEVRRRLAHLNSMTEMMACNM